MGIAFRTGSGSSATSGYTAVSSEGLALSSSIVSGDLVVVAVCVAVASATSANTISLSGGSVTWTQETPLPFGGGSGFGSGITMAVFTAAAGASTPGATVTATFGTSGTCMVAAASWSGASGVDIYPTPASATATAGVTTLAEPSGSVSAATDWLVDIIGLFTVSTASVTLTYPTDAATARESVTGDYQILAISDSNGAVAAGPVGGHSWSWTGDADGCGILLAIKAAAVSVALTAPGITLAAPALTPPAVVQPVFPAPDAQLDLRVELCAGTTWTTVTSDCDHGPVTITRGHPDESTTVSPASLDLTLTNGTARYSPDNPMSDLWPWCLQNMPVRVSIPATVNYLRLEPQPGDTPCAYVTDTAALHITGSLEVRWAGRLTDWQGGVLGARVNGSTPSWYWVLNSDGTMTLSWRDSGAVQHTASSDAPLPFITAPFAVKVTLNVGTGTVTFYTASSVDGTYSQVGDAMVSGATSVAAGVAALETGTTLSASYDLGQLCGAVTEFRLYSGIAGSGGTIVADGQFSAQAAGATSWTGTDGLSWLLSSPAEISDRRYRGHFEGSEWPQDEPEYNPDAANDGSVETDALVPLTGGGLLRRLGRNGSPVESPMKRALLAASGDLACVALWPCEPDTSSSTQLSSAVPGVPAGTYLSGSPTLADSSPFGGATQALPALNGSQWHFTVPPYTSNGSIIVRVVVNIAETAPSGAGDDAWPLIRLLTTGSVKWVDVWAGEGQYQGIYGWLPDATEAFDSGAFQFFGGTSTAYWLSLEGTPVSGGIQWNLAVMVPGETAVGECGSGTLAGYTVGDVTDIYINPYTEAFDTTAAGMISVQSAYVSMSSLYSQLNAYTGEAAGNRFARLCGENDIACRIRGNAADTTLMGAQASDTLTNLLQDCAGADLGAWTECREVLGWGYTTRKALYNQPATAAVSYLSDHLSPWTTPPTRDDQIIVNDVTVVNDISGSAQSNAGGTGASIRVYAAPGQPIDGGRMSTLTPADGGVGSYPQSYQIVLATDDQLPDEAGWLLHLGTVDQARLPGILIDLASTDAEDIYDDVLDLDLGGRLVITDPPRRLGFEAVTQLAQQLTEKLWYDTLTVGICGVPELPYQVVADGGGMHLAPGAGALSSAVTSTATSWSVAADAADPAKLWTVNPADYPQDWVIDGERVTVTAMTGTTSPQTATVTRAVNGVIKSHSAGAAVTTWPPPVIGL